WTYLNRLRLKSHFKKQINAAACRERTFTGENKARGGMVKRLVILACIAFIVFTFFILHHINR
ncbi:MAG: hypothetical protein HY789_00220, partial [Deltaproteobacteria bacterium]|nr:hypothetical protein [Deltaproteobacteria bacterium]